MLYRKQNHNQIIHKHLVYIDFHFICNVIAQCRYIIIYGEKIYIKNYYVRNINNFHFSEYEVSEKYTVYAHIKATVKLWMTPNLRELRTQKILHPVWEIISC